LQARTRRPQQRLPAFDHHCKQKDAAGPTCYAVQDMRSLFGSRTWNPHSGNGLARPLSFVGASTRAIDTHTRAGLPALLTRRRSRLAQRQPARLPFPDQHLNQHLRQAALEVLHTSARPMGRSPPPRPFSALRRSSRLSFSTSRASRWGRSRRSRSASPSRGRLSSRDDLRSSCRRLAAFETATADQSPGLGTTSTSSADRATTR
jgi:hypothetical protein